MTNSSNGYQGGGVGLKDEYAPQERGAEGYGLVKNGKKSADDAKSQGWSGGKLTVIICVPLIFLLMGLGDEWFSVSKKQIQGYMVNVSSLTFKNMSSWQKYAKIVLFLPGGFFVTWFGGGNMMAIAQTTVALGIVVQFFDVTPESFGSGLLWGRIITGVGKACMMGATEATLYTWMSKDQRPFAKGMLLGAGGISQMTTSFLYPAVIGRLEPYNLYGGVAVAAGVGCMAAVMTWFIHCSYGLSPPGLKGKKRMGFTEAFSCTMNWMLSHPKAMIHLTMFWLITAFTEACWGAPKVEYQSLFVGWNPLAQDMFGKVHKFIQGMSAPFIGYFFGKYLPFDRLYLLPLSGLFMGGAWGAIYMQWGLELEQFSRTVVLLVYIIFLGLGYNIFCVIVFPKSADLTPKELHAIVIPMSMIIGHSAQNVILDVFMGPNMKAADAAYKAQGIRGKYGDSLDDYNPNLKIFALTGLISAVIAMVFLSCARPSLEDEPKELKKKENDQPLLSNA
eukprot:CAMPEP_0197529484 /NCGR_PEP_ID=MMETSP1318-20131121/28533_1 /TAXON_ID=552666 /ORGANISM="Partenskyella glossopodia, Strain RCC365" /LENGTH=503 /DNA_ID=CAMNT_0043084959 /DNA_START=46 /DNA_END=1557 /DNA_ORIENTATION=-